MRQALKVVLAFVMLAVGSLVPAAQADMVYTFNLQPDSSLPANFDPSLTINGASLQVMDDLDTIQLDVTFANPIGTDIFLPKNGSTAIPQLKVRMYNPAFGGAGEDGDFNLTSISKSYLTGTLAPMSSMDINPQRGASAGLVDASSCSPKSWEDPSKPKDLFFSFAYGCSQLPQKFLVSVSITGDSNNIQSPTSGVKTFPSTPYLVNLGVVPGMHQPQFISALVPESPYYTANNFQMSLSVNSTAPSTYDFASITPLTCNFQDPHSSVVTFFSGGACTVTIVAEASRAYYRSNTVTLTFNILSQQQSQSIQAQLPSSISLDNPRVPFIASTSAGLPVRIDVVDSSGNICSVDNNSKIITATLTGFCYLALSNSGNESFLPATEKVRIQVTGKTAASSPTIRVKQKISFNPPSNALAGQKLVLSIAADSGLDLTIISLTPKVCLLFDPNSWSRIALLSSGLCTLKISQDGNATYLPVIPITTSFSVGHVLISKGTTAKPVKKK
jgi:hypothetical protein